MCKNRHPPPRSTGLSRLFNPCFPGLNSDTVTLSLELVIISFGSHSSTSSSTTTPSPTASSRLEHRVSVFPFLETLVLSLAGCLLPIALFLLANCRESSSLFGPLAPHLAASVVAHWGGNRTVPWPLVLRLLASAEHCSTGPASPAWSLQEPSDLCGLDPYDPLGLMWDVPWVPSRNP